MRKALKRKRSSHCHVVAAHEQLAGPVVDAAAALLQPQLRLECLKIVRECRCNLRHERSGQGSWWRRLRYRRARHVYVPRGVAPYAEV